MGFKLRYECEFCGYEITATKEEAKNAVCPCELKTEPEETVKPMTKEERQARYKRQYKENGYSWLGKKPWMWEGDLD